MSRALTAHAAHITTAAVQINTLTGSGKQVTLAVFRQLREEPLIAEDGTLNGVPWGTVNYHPDKCADDPEHMHVVWQRGADILRSRARLQEPVAFFNPPVYGDLFVMAHLRCLLLDLPTTHWGGKIPVVEQCGNLYMVRPGEYFGLEICIQLDLVRQVLNVMRAVRGKLNGWPDYARDRSVVLQDLFLVFGPSDFHDDDLIDRMHAEYLQEIKSEADRRQRHRDQIKAIADLPQLFIAV